MMKLPDLFSFNSVFSFMLRPMQNNDTHNNAQQVEVWDASLRLFHWLLAASFFAAWWSEGRDMRMHVVAGTIIAGLLLYRFIWGVTGNHYARFAQFLPSRQMINNHFSDLIQLRPGNHIGHTPIGSLMIFALLTGLLILVLTGMALLGLQMGVGLFAGWGGAIDFSSEVLIQSIHAWCLNLLLGLVFLHLAGIAVESLLQRHNLITAMITGKKTVKEVKK